MPLSARPLAAAVGLVLALCAFAALAANPADPFAPSGAGEDAAYRTVIRDGVAEYEAGHFEEARSLFRRAHAMNPSARTFRGIGMASFELRDYGAALRYLSAAVRDERRPLSPEQRKTTQELLDRSRELVDVITLNVVPGTARIVVDGRPADFEPDGTLALGLGAHSLEASAPAMATQSRVVNVRGGARQAFMLLLEPAPTPTDLPMRAAPVGAVVKTAALPARPGPQQAARAWLLGSAGAALVAAGAGIYWWRQAYELDACRNPNLGLRCTDASMLSTQRNLAMAATLATGAAALSMAVIGVLAWQPASTSARRHGALACGALPFGVACVGAF